MNEERTGERNFLPLSSAAREVFGVRHQDIDLFQYCPRCKHPEVFIEATSSTRDKYTHPLRIVASMCGVPTLLVRHEWNDIHHQYPVDVSIWYAHQTGKNDEPDLRIEGVPWSDVQEYLRFLHTNHEC
jgi:hypothetical protein